LGGLGAVPPDIENLVGGKNCGCAPYELGYAAAMP